MSDLALAFVDALDESGLALLAARLAPHLQTVMDQSPDVAPDEWLDSRGAAGCLGKSVAAIHKLTAARAIPFEQEGPGCKLWFRRSALDAWREAGGARSYLLRARTLPRRFHKPEITSSKAQNPNGRGGFRTCDLSRVKRALSH